MDPVVVYAAMLGVTLVALLFWVVISATPHEQHRGDERSSRLGPR